MARAGRARRGGRRGRVRRQVLYMPRVSERRAGEQRGRGRTESECVSDEDEVRDDAGEGADAEHAACCLCETVPGRRWCEDEGSG